MARHGQVSAGAGAPPEETAALEETAAPAGGDNPPDPGIAEGGARQEAAAPGTSPPADRAGKGKKRVKCAALKGGKITVGKGEVVLIDENGFFEVSGAEAERLLTIPGYTEV